MSYYKTERLYYKNYDELDEELSKLNRLGWRVIVFREDKLGTDCGYEAMVTFKIYD